MYIIKYVLLGLSDFYLSYRWPRLQQKTNTTRLLSVISLLVISLAECDVFEVCREVT